MNKAWRIKPWAKDIAAEERRQAASDEKIKADLSADNTDSGKNEVWKANDRKSSIQSLKNSSLYFDELFGSFKLGGSLRKKSATSSQIQSKGAGE